MGELLLKLIGPLLEPVVERIATRARDLSVVAKVGILAITLLAAIMAYFSGQVLALSTSGVRATKVLYGGDAIPLNADIVTFSRGVVTHLSNGLEAELTKPQLIYPQSAWTLAQVITSRDMGTEFQQGTALNYLHEASSPLCHCWEEVPGDGAPMVAVSGWILLALSSMKEQASNGDVEYILNEQNADGSWSIFRNPENENTKETHSTFATAWSILGLQAQLGAGLIASPMRNRVITSLRAATAWLISQRQPGSRWKPYPLAPNGSTSLSLSGLAMHALHKTDRNIATEEREWLDNLPLPIPKPNDSDYKLQWFRTRHGTKSDHFHHLVLPWLLIATADAYRSGNLAERIHALSWLEQALDQRNIGGSVTSDKEDWWKAELLLAIRYVLAYAEEG